MLLDTSVSQQGIPYHYGGDDSWLPTIARYALAAQRHYPLTGYKILFALLGFSAIVTELATLAERGKLNVVNIFSYFTIESNLVAVTVLLVSAVAIPQDTSSRFVTMLRGAATLYIVIVGIVFSVLLAGIEGAEFTAVPWDNYVLHYIMPIAVAIDWIIDKPTQRITFRQASIWLLYPIAYVLYSLIRGPLVHWYPYPFLDATKNSYAAIAATSVALSLFSAGVTWLLTLRVNRTLV